MPFRFSGYSGMDIGRDHGLPVERSYADKSPFAPHLTKLDAHTIHEHEQQAALAA